MLDVVTFTIHKIGAVNLVFNLAATFLIWNQKCIIQLLMCAFINQCCPSCRLFQNLLEKAAERETRQEYALAMIQCKVLKQLENLEQQKYDDEDITEDIKFLLERLGESVQDLRYLLDASLRVWLSSKQMQNMQIKRLLNLVKVLWFCDSIFHDWGCGHGPLDLWLGAVPSFWNQQLIWRVQFWTQVWPPGMESRAQVREILAGECSSPEREELRASQVRYHLTFVVVSPPLISCNHHRC